MSQRFVCGMRRFDKHRVESLREQGQGVSEEIEERLRQREAQDHALFGVPATPHTTPVLSGTVHLTPPSPLLCSAPAPGATPVPAPGYTPWRTPSACVSPVSPATSKVTAKSG
jgi:hypothetical protein